MCVDHGSSLATVLARTSGVVEILTRRTVLQGGLICPANRSPGSGAFFSARQMLAAEALFSEEAGACVIIVAGVRVGAASTMNPSWGWNAPGGWRNELASGMAPTVR
jgi:hypothetical protein